MILVRELLAGTELTNIESRRESGEASAALDVDLGVGAFTVAGDARVQNGEDTDRFGFDGVTINGDLVVQGGRDATSIELDSTTIGGDVRLEIGKGNATLQLTDAEVGEDLKIPTRSGSAAIAIQSSTIGDDVRVRLGRGANSLQFDEVTFGDQGDVRGGSQDDFVIFDTVDVDGRTRVRLMNGDDSLVLAGTNAFAGKLRMDGGHGNDVLDTWTGSTFADGQKSHRVEGTDVPDSVTQSRLNDPATGLLTRTSALTAFFNGLATNALATNALALVLDVSANQPIASNGTHVVGESQFQIRATTTPGATVKIDRDGNGAFDDGEAVANAQGLAVITVTLLNNTTNRGANVLQVRSTLGSDQTTQSLNVHYAIGDVVRFDTSAGAFDVELLNTDAPNTVENFLDYRARFAGSIIHRSARNSDGSDFIVQGGAGSGRRRA